jgi:hypothetical protein
MLLVVEVVATTHLGPLQVIQELVMVAMEQASPPSPATVVPE